MSDYKKQQVGKPLLTMVVIISNKSNFLCSLSLHFAFVLLCFVFCINLLFPGKPDFAL